MVVVVGRFVLSVPGMPVETEVVVPGVPFVLGGCKGLSGTTGRVESAAVVSDGLSGVLEPGLPDPEVVSLPSLSVVGVIPAGVDDCCDDAVDSLITRAGPPGADDASEAASVSCPQAEHSSARAAAKAIASRFVI